MTAETISLHNVRYNPELGAFEALARTDDSTVLYTYRVHMKARPQAGFARVMRGLTERARDAHRRAAPSRTRQSRIALPELRKMGVALAA